MKYAGLSVNLLEVLHQVRTVTLTSFSPTNGSVEEGLEERNRSTILSCSVLWTK